MCDQWIKCTCPYCKKNTVEIKIFIKSGYYYYYFCDECFQKLFGFTFEKYIRIENKDEIHKKMFNNYKTSKPFKVLNEYRNIVFKLMYFRMGNIVKEVDLDDSI